ncbi:MAG TPA: polyprenyl synthetase family protein [Gaiellaceae bacterium]|nr:polyprenyl synthetase family protein [Gaiellaceae bacterium]
MSAVATVRATPGLDAYLDVLESRLADAVSARPGIVTEASAELVAAGGKRLRPVLVFLSTPPRRRGDARTVAAGVAVELVHVATLVHDDVLDGARTRRGEATVWARHGEAVARAVGDYLFARAFSELAATRDAEAVSVLARATLSLARGEAVQRGHAFRPETSIDEYLARCTLKTGKLFEAACLLGAGSRLAPFGRALGIAFQIADDILDCTGDADETGKDPGVDLRDGTPTLPLILAAREDQGIWRALAGEDVPDALDRVAASGALEKARAVALEYAARARAALDGEPDRESLEALTYAVVERRG